MEKEPQVTASPLASSAAAGWDAGIPASMRTEPGLGGWDPASPQKSILTVRFRSPGLPCPILKVAEDRDHLRGPLSQMLSNWHIFHCMGNTCASPSHPHAGSPLGSSLALPHPHPLATISIFSTQSSLQP